MIEFESFRGALHFVQTSSASTLQQYRSESKCQMFIIIGEAAVTFIIPQRARAQKIQMRPVDSCPIPLIVPPPPPTRVCLSRQYNISFAGNPRVHSPHQQDSSFTMNTNANSSAPPSTSPGLTNADCANFIKKQAMSAEIFHGIPLNNEYELIPFNHFTYSRVYPIELGLGKRVVEKPIGFKRKDLLESLMKAIETLNKNVTEKLNKYTLDDFLEGLYRSEPTTGTQYELYFRTKIAKKSAQGGFRKVVVFRPFAPVQTITTEVLSGDGPRDKELIHIILPLSGRTATFQSFMDKFVKIGLKNDRRVHLTVVYFGEEGLSEARAIMSRVLMTKNRLAGGGGTGVGRQW
ncbi:hypothetical protein GEV33_013936 [Tenebrio molitor]|uniref:Hexosyltransferase n=1 Tax=Tenebrio molitor TaxID=7067 RepID=A0A8J6GZ90_TENMO|nr:hypothetical protein GEV33_013936 [Tenebrio molitor]